MQPAEEYLASPVVSLTSTLRTLICEAIVSLKYPPSIKILFPDVGNKNQLLNRYPFQILLCRFQPLPSIAELLMRSLRCSYISNDILPIPKQSTSWFLVHSHDDAHRYISVH